MLQDIIAKMDKAEAAYHMKRCVDSGLWVADANTLKEEEATEIKQEEIKEEPLEVKKED